MSLLDIDFTQYVGMYDINLVHGDCFDYFPLIKDKSVDMILCDLPYGTTQNKWDSVIPFESLWKEYERVIKDNGAIVLTASQPFTSALVMSNAKMSKYAWVWEKTKITGVLNAKKQPVRQHEDILVFYKTQSTYNPQWLVRVDRLTKQGGNSENYGKRSTDAYLQEFTNYPRTILKIQSEGKNVHPTQKPVALMEYLIKTYTNEGEFVLDNCMGSGTTGEACLNTGRRFLGIEKERNYYDKAVERINQMIIHKRDLEYSQLQLK